MASRGVGRADVAGRSGKSAGARAHGIIPPRRAALSVVAFLILAGVFASVSPLAAQPLTPLTPQAVAVTADPAGTDSLDSSDSLEARAPASRADTARVVMHHFNHRQQIITGSAIMAALVSVMVVMNNYNPRVPQ